MSISLKYLMENIIEVKFVYENIPMVGTIFNVDHYGVYFKCKATNKVTFYPWSDKIKITEAENANISWSDYSEKNKERDII